MVQDSGPPQVDTAERVLKCLFALGAVVEMVVGLGAVACPEPLVWLLLNASLDEAGNFVARLLGMALIALGLCWWSVREKPRESMARGGCFGFVAYNLGAGLWLGLTALATTERVLLLSALGLFHGAMGLVFAALRLPSVWRGSPTSPITE
jgi:hypothetical protein